MESIFIDESKSKNYIVCAVKVQTSKVPEVRKILSGLRLRGQNRIHFVSESDRRRKQILATLRKLDVEVVFFVSKAPSDAQARSLCLRAMVMDLNPETSYQIWLEVEINHLDLDRSVITKSLRAVNRQESVEFTHSDSKVQSLLWLPDALAWCENRGGIWRRELDGFKTRTVNAD